MKLIILLLILLFLISGCVSNQNDVAISTIKNQCISLCNAVKSKQDISIGPCLSDNNANWTVNDWVCDVVHSPRQDVDNLAENQCQSFRSGQAHHFVEVDTSCNLIRAV